MNVQEDQEKVSGKAYDVELARRLWRFIQPHRKVFFLSLLLLPVHQLFNLLQPLLLKAGIDAVGVGDGAALFTTGVLFLAALLAEAAAYSSTTCPCWWPSGLSPTSGSRCSPTCSGCP